MWNGALEKARLDSVDKRTNRHKTHPQSLRKYFRAKLGVEISVDVVEALMGHEGYLTEVYKRYPDPAKTLAEFYKKGEHALFVFTESGEVSKLREEVVKQKDDLQRIVNRLSDENLTLRAKVETQEAKIERLEAKQERILTILEKYEKIAKSPT